jgi:hypothetical protein
MLAKGECLGAVQLGTLLNLAKATLTRELMLLRVHLNVVLREAKGAVLSIESAVPTF